MLRTIVLGCIAAKASGHDGHSGSGSSPSSFENTVACPGSPAARHAWFAVEVTASAPCTAVKAEIEARIAGQATAMWRTPHDGEGGKQAYTAMEGETGQVMLSRSSGSFTDNQLFTFTEIDSNSCLLTGCSESQGFSMGDASTNYCNLRNLYCGSAEECCPMETDFAFSETKTVKSSGASKDVDRCLGGSGGSGGGFSGGKQTTCLKDAAQAETTVAPSSNDIAVVSTSHAHGGSGDMVHDDDGGSGADAMAQDATTVAQATTTALVSGPDNVSGGYRRAAFLIPVFVLSAILSIGSI